MSNALLRRKSSKLGLLNLLRITAQRSVEDAEETEREQRRRARAGRRSGPGGPPQDNSLLAEDGLCENGLKPSCPSPMEEDEGFSDWTQRLEKRRQRRMEEQGQAEEEQPGLGGSPKRTQTDPSILALAPRAQQHRDEEEDEEKWEQTGRERNGWEREEAMEREDRIRRRREREEEEEAEEKWEQMGRERNGWEREEAMEREDGIRRRREREEEEDGRLRDEEELMKRSEAPKGDVDDKGKEKRKERRISFTSRVFLQQPDLRHTSSNGDTAGGEVTSHMVTSKITPSRSQSLAEQGSEELDASLETEQTLERIRRCHQEKESQELEELRHRQAEAEVELQELNQRREERRRVREEEERRREEEVLQLQVKEEEERQRMKEDIEKRRMEATERRMKRLSTSSAEAEEPFSPLSPKSPSFKNESEERVTTENTCSINERTESLNRSLKKSNSIKKIQAPVVISKIDDRLEQYNQAIEISAREAKAAKQVVMDIPSSPDPVASKKSLFEAGEAWNQNSIKATPSKDAEGLKVGVADLITQWVKGTPDGSCRTTPSKPTEVKAGDVLSKKNLWETLGDTSSGKSGPEGKGTSGKKYKFLVTGHGKYEKIAVGDDDYNQQTNGKSPGLYHEDL